MSTTSSSSNINSIRTNSDDVIYKDFRDGMRNQARDHVRLAGDLTRSIIKKSSILPNTINNFCQLDKQFENIENNLNKVRVLSRDHTRE